MNNIINTLFYNDEKCENYGSKKQLIDFHNDSLGGGKDKCELNGGAIAGIFIAVVLIVAAVALLVYFFKMKKVIHFHQEKKMQQAFKSSQN